MTTKSGNLGLGSLEKWDIATTKKFLKLYRNFKCLWDHTDPSYKDKVERQNALESIAISMNIHGFDSRYVILKVRALRSTYLYERRKVRLRLKNGEKTQTHLGWFHLADSFLRNYVVEKSYLHGDVFKDPNKELPPPIDNAYENSTDASSTTVFPKDETSQYDLYDCPKSQVTSYGDDVDDDDDHSLQLHVLEVQQQSTPIQPSPQQQQIQEIQIKNSTPSIKQTRAQSRKIESKKPENVPLKRIKLDSQIATTSVASVDNKIYSTEDQLQQQPQHLNQISYMIPISQPSTSAPVVPVSVQQQQHSSNMANYMNINCNATSDSGTKTAITTTSQSECINSGTTILPPSNKLHEQEKEDEFDAFAKSVAMQLRKIPQADAYSLQVQFQLLLSQAKLKAMGKDTNLDLSGFFGKVQ